MEQLADLKRQLKDALPKDGISQVIKSLKEVLPDNSPKYNLIIQLESEYKDVKLRIIEGILSEEDITQQTNLIRKRLLELIDGLEADDFDRAAPRSELEPDQKIRTGHVLYHIPGTMQVDKEVRCLVRIAFDKTILVEDIDLDDDTKVRADVRISDYMKVEIMDPAAEPCFKIRTTSEPTQFIDKDDFTEWRFYVCPLVAGEHVLELKITIILMIDGEERVRERTLEESVVIVAEPVAEPAEPAFKQDKQPLSMAAGLVFMARPTPPSGGSGEAAARPAPSAAAPPPPPWTVPPSVVQPSPMSPPPMAPSSTRRSRSAFRPWIIGLMVIGFLGIVISVYQTVNMGEARVSAAKEAINHPEQLADTLQLEDSLLLMPVPQDTMPAARDTSTAGNVSSSRTEPAEDGPAASRTITSPPTVDAPTPTEPRMVGIIAGNYIMGCDTNLANNNCPDDEHPPHPVRVERFHMSQYEVTNAEYAVFLNANAQSKDIAKWIKLNESNNRERCRISLIDGKFRVEKGYENYPVIYVTWYGAVAYAEWLSKSTGKRYRLPTEAEWEFVARNGGKGGVYAGGDDAGAVAWYRRNAGGRTHPVGERRPVMGIYDLNGNVWEWTADCWHDNYQGAPATSQPAWTEGGNCRYRVMRGGSWFSEADILRVTYRDSYLASEGTSDCGFRLVYD